MSVTKCEGVVEEGRCAPACTRVRTCRLRRYVQATESTLHAKWSTIVIYNMLDVCMGTAEARGLESVLREQVKSKNTGTRRSDSGARRHSFELN